MLGCQGGLQWFVGWFEVGHDGSGWILGSGGDGWWVTRIVYSKPVKIIIIIK